MDKVWWIVLFGWSCFILSLSFVNYIHEIQPHPELIYIAGKYSGNVTYNVQQAEYYGMKVADKCNYPLVPTY